jgi:hypothetical protein
MREAPTLKTIIRSKRWLALIGVAAAATLPGISNAQDAAYQGNIVTTTNGTQGTVTGGVNMGTNSCNGTTSCS